MLKKNKTKTEYLQSIENKNEFVKRLSNNITFNLKYFQSGDGVGQSFKDWEQDQILADLNEKLKVFSEKKKLELIQERTLEIFRNYPKDSLFTRPKALQNVDIKWARLRLAGARRVIGFFISEEVINASESDESKALKDIFYIVFLDKNHEFAPYAKKGT